MNIYTLRKTLDIEKIYFVSFLLFAFTLPLSRAAVSFFTIFLPFIWIIEGNFREKINFIKHNTLLKILIAFILLNILSLLWTQNFIVAQRHIRLLGYFATTFVIATSFRPHYTHTIISAFLSGMFLSEIVAYGSFFGFWNLHNNPEELLSPFMMHIDYSVFLAFTSIILLNRIISKRYSLQSKLFFTFFFLTVTGNLFLSVGRTGQVAFFIAIFVMVALHFKTSFKGFVIFLILAGTIYTSAYITSTTFQKRVTMAKSDIERLIDRKDFTTSLGIRAAFWITTVHILQKELLLGVGVGDYKDTCKEELSHKRYAHGFDKGFMSNSHPHNQYLLIALQTGLIGLFLFFYFIYHFFTLPISNKEIKEISILFGVIFFLSCLMEPLFIKQFTLALFSFYVGIFVSQQKNS